MRIARPYPAPCTMSSVPYVPPDTIKNVAATRGHSVSRIDFFFDCLNRGSAGNPALLEGLMPGCKMLAGEVAVANSYVFLLKRLTSHHRVSLENVARGSRGDRRFPGISAKLVRISEITGIFHRCKNIFDKY